MLHYKRFECPACHGRRFFRIRKDMNWTCPACDLEGYLLLRSDTVIDPHFVSVIRDLVAKELSTIRADKTPPS